MIVTKTFILLFAAFGGVNTLSFGTFLAIAAFRLAIPAMVFVGLKIPAPAIAFVLIAGLDFLACAAVAICIGIALRLAIPAMGVVGLKISAPSLAFVLRAGIELMASAIAAILICAAFCLAIPAVVLVGLKIPAPTVAFVLRA